MENMIEPTGSGRVAVLNMLGDVFRSHPSRGDANSERRET